MARTWWPAATNAAHNWVPTKPVAPATTTFMIGIYPLALAPTGKQSVGVQKVADLGLGRVGLLLASRIRHRGGRSADPLILPFASTALVITKPFRVRHRGSTCPSASVGRRAILVCAAEAAAPGVVMTVGRHGVDQERGPAAWCR